MLQFKHEQKALMQNQIDNKTLEENTMQLNIFPCLLFYTPQLYRIVLGT